MTEMSVNQVLTGPQLGLAWGPSDLLIVEIGGRTVLYALSRTDSALAEVTINADGSLTAVDVLSLNGAFAAGSEPLLGTYVHGANIHLTLSGLDPSAGAFVALGSDGSLVGQTVQSGVAQMAAPQTLEINGDPSLVSGRASGGIELFREGGSGLIWAATLDDSSTTYLGDVSASAHVQISGADYYVSASASENGIQITQVTGAGELEAKSALGAAEGLPISVPSDLDVISRLGETLVVLGSAGSSSLSTMTLDAAAIPSLTDHILDSGATRIQSVTTLDAITTGDFAFVAAGGGDGGVSLFTVLPGGRLVHLSTVADDGTNTLLRPSSVTLTVEGGALQILVASAWEPGLTRLSYDIGSLGAVLVGSGSNLDGSTFQDQLIGSDQSETMNGGAGDDILVDGHGSDVMTGGSGEDLFIFVADGVSDSVVDFEKGVDRLDLSSFDFLYDISQLEISPTSGGATLSFGGETILLSTSDGSSLSASDLTNADILNVDRPPLLPVENVITGGPLADTLNGSAGDDTIEGGGGDDALSGFGGQDVLIGGDGFDDLDGGSGDDSLDGGAAPDTLIGGEGDDYIDGGAGGDLIYGDDIV